MGWNEVDLSQVNPNIEPIAEGMYNFALMSARYDAKDPSQISCRAAITDGDFSGRQMFFDFPDPDRFQWSPKTLRRFESALGVDCEDGEDKVAWLNRCINSHFRAKVKHSSYTPEGSDRPVVKEKLMTFSFEPAA
jgi:hypothetical protein